METPIDFSCLVQVSCVFLARVGPVSPFDGDHTATGARRWGEGGEYEAPGSLSIAGQGGAQRHRMGMAAVVGEMTDGWTLPGWDSTHKLKRRLSQTQTKGSMSVGFAEGESTVSRILGGAGIVVVDDVGVKGGGIKHALPCTPVLCCNGRRARAYEWGLAAGRLT